MKLIPVQELIEDKNLLLIDDSIVRGTQLEKQRSFYMTAVQKKCMFDQHVHQSCLAVNI